ncbi:MAG TPA: MtnX-like HAD-IB family phosphatase [Syntrophomonadaceae bacterium]|nr:MtnX-like HAD-IB family phosphatase [Syntrophomonadaceae bacterium]
MDELMFFIDFDGTISREDVCASMVKNFARKGWQEINHLWEERLISTEECAQRTLDLMEASPEDLEAFFKQMEIDPGFLAFVDWSANKEYPLYILSDGYDNYIKEILTRFGILLPYYANHLDYEEGWRIRCCHQDQECRQCGVCKTKLIEELIKPGYKRVYIGDGYSDFCPAASCDLVFAKNQLAALCQGEGISFYAYKDFSDVQKILQDMIGP